MVVPNQQHALEAAIRFVRHHGLHKTDPEFGRLVRNLEIIRFPSVVRTRSEEQLIAKVQRCQQALEEIPYFPAPANHVSKGQIILGTQLLNNVIVTYPARRLVTHCLLPGSTGTGKSTLIANIVGQTRLLPQPPRLIVPDHKDDARRWPVQYPDFISIEHDTAINPLDVPFLKPDDLRALFVDILGASMWMGQRQTGLLTEAVRRAFASHAIPCLADVYQQILEIRFPKITFNQIDDKERLLHRFSLIRDAFPVMFATRRGIPIEQLLEHHSLYLRVLHQTKVEEWLATLLMHYVFYYHRINGHRNELRHLAVMDEAILNWAENADTISRTPLLQELFSQLREWSTGVVASTTSLKLTSTLLKNNCGLYLCTHNTAELDELHRTVNLTTAQTDWMAQHLQLGQAIVRWTEEWKLPMLIQFPIMTLSGTSKDVTEREWESVKERARALTPVEPAPVEVRATNGAPAMIAPNAHATATTRTTPEANPPSSKQAIALNAHERSLLEAICASPAMPCTSCYKTCHLHLQSGDRARKKLELLGLIDAEPMVVRSGRGGKGIGLRATRKGYALLGKQPPKGPKGHCSIQHEFLARGIARVTGGSIETMLDTKSIDVVIAHNTTAHTMLMQALQEHGTPLAPTIALNDGDLIGIEIEVSDPERSAPRNFTANHEAGVALNVIAVLPKAVAPTTLALQASIPAPLYPRVVVIDALRVLEALEEGCEGQH